MASGENKWRVFTDSHFNWNMQPEHTSKDIDSLLGQIKIHLEDQQEMMTIPALLFKAFLYVSEHMGKNKKDPEAALETLDTAWQKIKDCASENERLGFAIVHHTLKGKIYQIMGDFQEENFLQKVRNLHERKTKDCQAYIDATRGFALSRLGPRRLGESIKYFQKAVVVCEEEIDWLFCLSRMIGRNKDYKQGPGDSTNNLTKKQ